MLFEKKSYQLQPVAGIHVDVMNVNYLNYFLEWLIDDVRRKTWIWYIGQGQGLAFKDLYVLSAALKKIHAQWKEVCQVPCIHIKLSISTNKPIPKTVISNCTFLYLNANIKFNINILHFESLWLSLDVPNCGIFIIKLLNCSDLYFVITSVIFLKSQLTPPPLKRKIICLK